MISFRSIVLPIGLLLLILALLMIASPFVWPGLAAVLVYVVPLAAVLALFWPNRG